MNKDLLCKFFSGKQNDEETKQVVSWLEASEENEKVFFNERKLYDSILLMNEADWQATPLGISATIIPFVRKYAQIAAIILLAVTLSYVYFSSKKTLGQLAVMNTITVPAGQRANLTLADGTNVWLNARSTLQYPTSFTDSNRNVILNGEAYFNVAKNEGKPFTVKTRQYEVKVFGTQFNLQAYDENDIFETALMEGSVQVTSNTNLQQGSTTLKPGTILRIKKGELSQSPIKDYDIFRWKEGLICFKDQTFIHIMYEFEKTFGCHVVVNNQKVLQHHYTGKFRQSDGVVHALRVLQLSINFSFSRDDETNTVYVN